MSVLDKFAVCVLCGSPLDDSGNCTNPNCEACPSYHPFGSVRPWLVATAIAAVITILIIAVLFYG